MRREFTFDRFVPTPASANAYRACGAMAECAPTSPGILLLHGPSGTGKTHLLHSIGHAVLHRSPARRLACVTVTELVDEIIDALRRDCSGDFRKYSQLDVLLVDDLHVLAGRPRTQREIAGILRACLDAGVRVVCAAAVAPIEIAELSAWLRSLPRSQLVVLPAT